MKRVALKVAYLGTDFHGFQRQPGLRTVEDEILQALKKVNLIDNIQKCGFGIAGRTDRGVHALGNVVSFLTDKKVFINQINDVFPTDIKILGLAKVPLNFKTRYAAQRWYRYLFVNENVQFSIDLNKMALASQIFKGTHDFSNFSKRSEKNPVRTIKQVHVYKHKDAILVDVIGDSFLWNMVRKMVSVILNVGKGVFNVEDVSKFLDPQNSVSIKPAAPEGLILMDVVYDGVGFKLDPYAKNKFIKSLQDEYLHHKTLALSGKEMIKTLMSQN